MTTVQIKNHTTASQAPQPGTLVDENTTGQCRRMIAHLKAGKTFTSLSALYDWGCLNCKGRVHDLRNRFAIPVTTTMTLLPNGKRVAVYGVDKNFFADAN